MATKRTCPAGFDKAKHSPVTGKRYKRQMCVSRSRPLRVVPPSALKKGMTMKRGCPTGYESASFSPATGKKYKKTMCVNKTSRGGRIQVVPLGGVRKRRRRRRR